jgi:hypothetical protein
MGGPVHAATDPADACKDTKAKTTGKKASALLKAYGKNIKKPDAAKLAGSVSKAQSKMTKGFVKAESKGGCETTGDVGTIEAKTDAFAASMIEDIGGATCGNGIKGGAEECDAGPPNGAGPSGDCLSGTCNAGCECAGCGDGIVAGGEDCDEGGANGTSASCCTLTCTFVAASTACDDTDGNVCTTAGCSGASGDCDQGHVLAPSSTPCPDTDGDTCTTSGCDGAGICDQGHAQAPASTPCADTDGNVCTTAGCDGVGGCDQGHVLAPASNPCPDTDGNVCTTAGCDGAGICDQGHISAPASNPCPDVDGNVCTTAGCDGAGSCNQLHILVPNGNPCGNPADTDCSNPDTCDGLGSCVTNDEPNSFPCPDTDGNVCTSAGCDGVGGCDQGHVNAPASNPCPDIDGNVCTTAGCDGAGTCSQLHILAPPSVPCPDVDGNVCTTAGCNGAGACNQSHVLAPASTPCGDIDGEPCTTAGCDGAGNCNQGHVIAPNGSTPTGCDAVGCSPETCQGGVCTVASSCCTDFPNGFLSFETGLATGNCGVLRNFRCSNDANAACAVNSDCPASGVCNEVIGGGLPLNLECGGLYTGGGGNSVPLPFPVPDMGQSYTRVTSCDPNTGVLISGPTAPGDGGGLVNDRNCTTGRTCTGGTNAGATCVIASDCDSNVCTTNCRFGPPLPIPNAMTPPTSVCTINDVGIDASGTTQCDGGDTDVSAPLRANVFLSGDLFTMTTPPNIPGVQPCPLCDRFCIGGTDANFPCADNTDCNSGNCNTQTTCLGGPNAGFNCTPATSSSSALGDLQNAFPTSHDCPPEPTLSITDAIGGLPVAFALTSGTLQANAEDLNLGAGGNRVFAGFCRDINIEGSGCFEGDTNIACPVAGDLNGVPCATDADCSAPYESCAQRTAGAFSRAAATQINVFGLPDGQCLGDGGLHDATLVSVFDIPPTFDAVVDAAGDLPGPGTAMLQGDAQLLPSPSAAFVDMGSGLLE